MKARLLLTATFITLTINCFGQQDTTWNKWAWLIGEWIGDGDGKPGQGSGKFSFSLDLGKKILVRKSHSEYPATANKPQIIHDDLMVIYPEGAVPAKAIYFDNEGHTINYAITYADKSIVMTSNKVPNAPTFRLTYSLFDTDSMNTKFEISRDGINFMAYIEGKSKKIK